MIDMRQRDAFEDALKKSPCDTATRRVFSDWLEEAGLDDEAVEQRRMSTVAWVDAYRWMVDLADRSGTTCSEETYDRRGVKQDIRKITVDDLLKAGHDWVESGKGAEDRWDRDVFVQLGDEDLRNRMFDDGMKDAYWANWEIVTGVSTTDEDRVAAPFGCNC